MLLKWQVTSASGLEGASDNFGKSAAGRRYIFHSTRALEAYTFLKLEHGKKEPGLRTIEILALGFEITPEPRRGIGSPSAAD